MLVTRLQTVQHTQNLGGIPTRRRWVAENQADSLLGVDDENGANREGNALLVDIGRVLVVQHVVQQRDLALLVAYYGELEVAAGDLVNVLDPLVVRLDGVGREADELCVAAREFWFELCEGAELGGADGGAVCGVREEDHPLVADEFVEVDGASRGFGLEVRGGAAQAEGLRASFGHCDCGGAVRVGIRFALGMWRGKW